LPGWDWAKCKSLPNSEVVLFNDTSLLFVETMSSFSVPEYVGEIADLMLDGNHILWVLNHKGILFRQDGQELLKFGEIPDSDYFIDSLYYCGAERLCVWGNEGLYAFKVNTDKLTLEEVFIGMSFAFGDSVAWISEDRFVVNDTRSLWVVDGNIPRRLATPILTGKIRSMDADSKNNLFVLTSTGLYYFETDSIP
jgi:hypothetical protein